MPPKKDKKGKKGKKGKIVVDPNKLNNVEKTFCELEIVAIKDKLDRYRNYLIATEEKTKKNTENIRKLIEESDDDVSQLYDLVENAKQSIKILQENYTILESLHAEEYAEGVQAVEDLKSQYRAMEHQLISEIKILQGKLNALAEFRQQRQKILMNFLNTQDRLDETEKKNQFALWELERKILLEKDELKTGVESRLLELTKEQQEYEQNFVSYAKRLAIEHVQMRTQINSLTVDDIQMRIYISEHKDRMDELNMKIEKLEKEKKNLLYESAKRTQEIDKISLKFLEMKKQNDKIKLYDQLYKDKQLRYQCALQRTDDKSKKLRKMSLIFDELKIEQNNLILKNKHENEEIKRLKNFIIDCRLKVLDAVKIEERIGIQKPTSEELKNDLVIKLYEILQNVKKEKPADTSVLTTTSATLTPYLLPEVNLAQQKKTLLDLFKPKERRLRSRFLSVKPISNIGYQKVYAPAYQPRSGDALRVIEEGSTFFVSSEHERMEIIRIELDDEVGSFEEEEESSDDFGEQITAKKSELEIETKSEPKTVQIPLTEQISKSETTITKKIPTKTTEPIQAKTQETELEDATDEKNMNDDDMEEGEEEEFIGEMFY